MKKLIVILFISFSSLGFAQKKYPLEILPGKSVRVDSGKDTLWVIDQPTMLGYMINWSRLEKCDSNNAAYTVEKETYRTVLKQKSDVIIEKNKIIKDKEEELAKIEQEKEQLIADRKKKRTLSSFAILGSGIVGFVVGWIL